MAQEIFVDLGFNASDDVAFTTIKSVFGQLSDGKWENSPRMTGYWLFADVVKNDGKICLKVSTKGWDNSIFEKGVYNPYVNMRSKQIMEKMANFVKAVAKDEYPSGWDRKNTSECDYLSRGNITVRVCDAYRVYDALKQRNPKVYASVAKNLIKIAKELVAHSFPIRRNELSRYIPSIKQYKIVPKYKLEAYYGEYGKYGWVYIIYTSKSTYPIRFVAAGNSESECLQELKKELDTHFARIDKEIKEKEEFQNPLKVGDFLVANWGYDQTNIDFYKVVKVVGKASVYLVEMTSKVQGSEMGYNKVVPGSEKGRPFLRRVAPNGYVKIDSVRYAGPWDGRPESETAPGWGH